MSVEPNSEMDSHEKVLYMLSVALKQTCQGCMQKPRWLIGPSPRTGCPPPPLQCRSGRELFTCHGDDGDLSAGRQALAVRIMYDRTGVFAETETWGLFWRQPAQPRVPCRWLLVVLLQGVMSAARDPHALTPRFRHPVHSRRGTVAHNQLLQTRGQRLSTSSEGLGMDKTALQLSGGKATCHSLLVWHLDSPHGTGWMSKAHF